ncbi:hypothetical protein CDD81_7305 [Ophiocordyceps australis]|uniref:Uncharacterized protein n=1 Tax=Ophiocordyceps australis TaxID=1399860 RepID=A0A2C5XYA6_9HYPO|nr:hypothetical protein CDD81_7305 [Ophiocordyceps australis]
MGGGKKIPYPKHVWSPSGGWYAQPKNWKSNTLIAGAVMFGICAIAFRYGAEYEERVRRPEPGEWYISRHWSRQLKEWDAEDRAKAEQAKTEEAKETQASK